MVLNFTPCLGAEMHAGEKRIKFRMSHTFLKIGRCFKFKLSPNRSFKVVIGNFSCLWDWCIKSNIFWYLKCSGITFFTL